MILATWLRRRATPALLFSLFAFGTAAGFGALTACGDSSSGSNGPGSSCPADLPSSCPTPAPSYAHDVKPVIEARCFPCHALGGAGVGNAGRDFSRYDAIFANRTSILSQVYACNMPPREATAPSSQERATLLAWLVCKAPNN